MNDIVDMRIVELRSKLKRVLNKRLNAHGIGDYLVTSVMNELMPIVDEHLQGIIDRLARLAVDDATAAQQETMK